MRWAGTAFTRLVLAAAALATLAGFAGAQSASAADPVPEITLRKSFPSRTAPGAEAAGVAADPSPGGRPGRRGAAVPAPPSGAGVAAALEAVGETVVIGGVLHLPDIGGGDVTLDTATTPLLELPDGRRLIIDASGSVPAGTARDIERRWSAYGVVRVTEGAGARALLAAVLPAAGYASLLRETPITFGRDATVRIVPDYVVLRREDDLLAGLTRAVSVVDDPADALPFELREMAAAHRILVLDLLDRDGSPVARPPWRDPRGTLTTVGAAGPALVLGELAEALDVGVEPTGESGTLMFTRGTATALVSTRPGAPPAGAGEAPPRIAAGSIPELPQAVGDLLAALGIPAIGPTVEFFRSPARAAAQSRFTITVPGWLAEAGGRRLLVTGAALPVPLRLFLAREGIDILEYRER